MKHELTALIADPAGVHARPAAKIVEVVGAAGSSITITNSKGVSADASSILGLLMLAIGAGEEVLVSGPAEQAELIAEVQAILSAVDEAGD